MRVAEPWADGRIQYVGIGRAYFASLIEAKNDDVDDDDDVVD